MVKALPKLLTIKEASEKTGIPERTLRTWISSGDRGLPVLKIRGRVFLNQNNFRHWLQMNSVAM